MNLQGDITEEAMCQGVQDSVVFLLFLTNRVLSRPFCLKEIQWAIEYEKPIVMMVETEERFWPWSLRRWKASLCNRGTDGDWEKGWLSRTYDQCPQSVRKLVEDHCDRSLMIPFRRRAFEVDAMVQELL